MALTLADVRRIASDIAQLQHPSLDVIGVTTREGSSASAEVIFAIRGCDVPPYRVVIGVSRISEAECGGAIRMGLGEHFVTQAISAASAG
jgi:hypothetical protein